MPHIILSGYILLLLYEYFSTPHLTHPPIRTIPTASALSPYNQTSQLSPTLLRVLLLVLLVRPGRAEEHCYTITSSISSTNCQICQSSLGMSCRYTASNGTVRSLLPSDCPKTCCNSKIFDNPNQYSLCSPQGTYS